MEEFQKQVLGHLRNITTQLTNLGSRLDTLEYKFRQGIKCHSEAFNQIRTVCQALANETRQTKENLEQYGGVIEQSSFFWLNVHASKGH